MTDKDSDVPFLQLEKILNNFKKKAVCRYVINPKNAVDFEVVDIE